MDVDSFAPRLSFFFNAHSDFLTEIAKFRAARRLYAKLMRDRFHATNDRSCMLRFHTQTAGSSLTAQQPDVNVVRTTLEALSAILGGTQSLHTNARDEALGLPTEDAAQLALRTQQIIAYETGIASVPDPVGGSYYIEELTDRIEAEAMDYIGRIDAMGGTLRAIEAGFIQSGIQNSAFEYQKEIESGRRVIVGVNRFEMEEREKTQVFRVDPAIERAQVEGLRRMRACRDAVKCQQTLGALEGAARGSENLMPRILAAAEANATVGEISDTLRRVFGEYREAA